MRAHPPRNAAAPEAGATPATAPTPWHGEGRSLGRTVLTLAVWPMLEQMLSFLVGFVDMTLAGHLEGREAIDATNAVGAAGYITWLMGLLQGAVGVGATALIARAVGARHKREVSAALGQSIAIAAVWGTVFGGLFLISAPMWGPITGLEGRAAEGCTQYLRLLAGVTPMMAILFVGAACLRGAGDFRSAFMVMAVVNAVNIGASILFVSGPAPIGGHGLTGIALGTVAAWIVGCAMMLWKLTGGRSRIRLWPHRLRLQGPMVRRIARVGAPNLMESSLFWLGNFLVLMIVGRLSEPAGVAVGAHMIAIRLEAFSFLPGFALSLAAATLVGQALGAGQPELARRAAWVCTGFGVAIMGTLGLLFILIPRSLVALVTHDASLIDASAPLLFVVGFAQIGFGVAMVLGGALRGAGDTRSAMALTFTSTYLVRLPLVWWVGLHMGWDLKMVWIVMSAELTLRGVLFLARFLHGGWMRVQV